MGTPGEASDPAARPRAGDAAVDPAAVIAAARERGWLLATAESLTAGAVVARLVDVPGSSAAVAGGAACYSYAAKHRVLGVDAAELERTGAVTPSVAAAMAEGALALYAADLAVSTTGVAGPGGGTRMKPVGTVHIACARENRAMLHEMLQLGDIGRDAIRMASVEAALNLIQAQTR